MLAATGGGTIQDDRAGFGFLDFERLPIFANMRNIWGIGTISNAGEGEKDG